MCQLNLDAYQGRVNNFFNTAFELPILFFTQLLGVALGIDAERLGFGKEFVPAFPVVEARLVERSDGNRRAEDSPRADRR
jgi:heterodisulfide reductase subunit B